VLVRCWTPKMLAAVLSLTSLAQSSSVCSPERCTGASPACPIATGITSTKTSSALSAEHVYFRNAAPFPAEILRVDVQGKEISHGILPPGMRRALMTQHGDVWVARAVRPATAADRRLLLEHRIGAVPIEDCDCPQPQFVDCSKPPTQRDDAIVSDPVVFENRALEPVDVFFWNGACPGLRAGSDGALAGKTSLHLLSSRGVAACSRRFHSLRRKRLRCPALPLRSAGTCEELVSWDEIGGVQPARHKPLLSTQGHAFRLRSAATRRFLMAHTLNDLMIRSCDEDEAVLRGSSIDGLDALRMETRFFEQEALKLRQLLSTEIASLALALSSHQGNATSVPAHGPGVGAVGVTAGGATWSLPMFATAK